MEKEVVTEKKGKQSLKFQRDKEKERVKGIFRYHEVPGGSVSFVYKKYKEDEVERYDMVDGQIYSIPLGVAKHLNKKGWYPVHKHALDERGAPSIKIGEKVRRFSFQSLEFIEMDDLTPDGIPAGESRIVTVERA